MDPQTQTPQPANQPVTPATQSSQPPSQPVSQPLADTAQIPPEPPKSSPFKLLEVGLLEAVFVIVVLFLLLGILNFFNIIPISSKIPFLSFLPHQQTQKPISTTKTTTQFLYDVNTANKALTTFVSTSLNPSYLPSSSSALFNNTQKNNVFRNLWPAGTSSAGTIFAYAPYTNNLAYELVGVDNVSFNPPKYPDASASVNDLAKMFFTNVDKQAISWKCQNKANNMWRCVGQQTISNITYTYSVQRFVNNNIEQISAQKCSFSDIHLLDPHPDEGCLNILRLATQ